MAGCGQWGQDFPLHKPQFSSLFQMHCHGKCLGGSTAAVSASGGKSQAYQFGIVDDWIAVRIVYLDPVAAFTFAHRDFGDAWIVPLVGEIDQ